MVKSGWLEASSLGDKMGCFDVNPGGHERTQEEIERFIERARRLGLMPETHQPSSKVPKSSVVLVDYMSLMK